MLALAIGGLGVALLIADGVDAYARAPLGFSLGLLAGVGWAAEPSSSSGGRCRCIRWS